MQQLDPEILTWLFIGAAGLAIGVWGVVRAVSKKCGEAELDRLGKAHDAKAGRRRERIAARKSEAPVVKKAEPKPRLPEHGPARPAAFLIAAPDGRTMVLQRAPQAECCEGFERIFASVCEAHPHPEMEAVQAAQAKLDQAALAFVHRGSALCWAVDSDLAHDVYMICRAHSEPHVDAATDPAAPARVTALAEGGLPMGTEGELPCCEAAALFAAADQAFLIAACPEGALLRHLEECLGSLDGLLVKLGKKSPVRAEDWRQTFERLKDLADAARCTISNGLWVGTDVPAALAEIDKLAKSTDERMSAVDADLEAACSAESVKDLEAADEALKRAQLLLMEREAAVLLLRAFSAASVLYSPDYRRGVHCSSVYPLLCNYQLK